MLKRISKYLKKNFSYVIKEKVIIPCLEGDILNGKTAFITGGTSGIGYSIAKSYLKNGATVIITGRNEHRINIAIEKLKSETGCGENNIYGGIMDLSDIETMKCSFYNIIEQSNSKVEIFVNNAGVNGGKNFPDTCEDEYDFIMDINLKGLYFISQEMANYFIINNIKGNILNIGSSSSIRPAISPYIISKWGERGLTLGMAKKYYKYGIVVNGLAPGPTLTPMLQSKNDNLHLEYSPIKRYLTPEEVGNMATILVSDMGKMIIGDTIYMTGGAGIITYDDMNY